MCHHRPCHFISHILFFSAEPQREELDANIRQTLIATARARGQNTNTNYPIFDANQVRYASVWYVHLMQCICSPFTARVHHGAHVAGTKMPPAGDLCLSLSLSACVAHQQLKQRTGESQV